jgi:hypothetical protein
MGRHLSVTLALLLQAREEKKKTLGGLDMHAKRSACTLLFSQCQSVKRRGSGVLPPRTRASTALAQSRWVAWMLYIMWGIYLKHSTNEEKPLGHDFVIFANELLTYAAIV